MSKLSQWKFKQNLQQVEKNKSMLTEKIFFEMTSQQLLILKDNCFKIYTIFDYKGTSSPDLPNIFCIAK